MTHKFILMQDFNKKYKEKIQFVTFNISATITYLAYRSSAVCYYDRRGRCDLQRGEQRRRLSVKLRRAEPRGTPAAGTLNFRLLKTHATMLLHGGTSAAFFAFFFYSHLLEPHVVLAFNLDTRQIIRKDGEPGSLFGFSLAMHRQLNPDQRM